MLAERKVFPMSGRVERIAYTVSSNATAYSDARLHQYQIDGFAVGVIGTALVLHGKYDPNQAWLPFMTGVILLQPPPEPKEILDLDEFHRFNMERLLTTRVVTHRHGRSNLDEKERMESRWEHDPVHLDERDQEIYFWPGEWGYDQHLLPFAEAQLVENKYEFDRANYLWDRLGDRPETEDDEDDDTRPHLEVTIHGLSRDDTIRWLRENCGGRFYVPKEPGGWRVSVTFERAADWMFAKLRFDGKDRFEELERPRS